MTGQIQEMMKMNFTEIIEEEQQSMKSQLTTTFKNLHCELYIEELKYLDRLLALCFVLYDCSKNRLIILQWT